MVDPGHNGGNSSHTREISRMVDAGGFQKECNTTGTSGTGLTEAEFNWQLAQRLAGVLQANGATVVLTRTDNVGWGPCVDERGLTAVRNRADLLVSIHADGAAASASGFHVIHPTAIAGFTDSTAPGSARLASAIRDSLVDGGFHTSTYTGGGTGTVARGDLGTLNRAQVPAVIVECGNMKNADDLLLFKTPAAQVALASALAQGVSRYLSE